MITNYDINGQNNENVEKRVVRLSFLMKGRVIMNLVIAEKPSVAQSIAKAIGVTTKHDGYLVGSGYLVSWCVGHLVELAEPEEYDGKYEKWRKEDLPILPTDWFLQCCSYLVGL